MAFVSAVRALYETLAVYDDWRRAHRNLYWREFGPSTEAVLQDMLDRPSVFLEAGHGLQVSQMYMGSDGGFSFEGLGAVVEQLRLLIRDLKFENAQLEERGRLENTALRLRMQREFGPEFEAMERRASRRLVDRLIEPVRVLIRLVQSRRLEDPGGNIDYVPPRLPSQAANADVQFDDDEPEPDDEPYRDDEPDDDDGEDDLDR